MNIQIKSFAAALLAAGLVSSQAYAADPTPPIAAADRKHVAHKAKPRPAPAATAAELLELKQEMESQIKSLKDELADRDARLQAAQQAAATAQAAAARAEAAATSQQQSVTDNATAVNALQSTVTDLKSNQAQVVTTIQDNQATIKKAIETPDTLHYKGITITPGGYMAAETVFRSKATGGDIATPFSAIPFAAADASALSEFYGSARQSRISMMATGQTEWGTLRGYVEADFLGTGVTSNNNQSNSYVLRQRVVWAQAALNNGWAFTGGQLWSLATEDRKGLSNLSGDILTPQTIDPNYNAGFVWTRQYGFRVTKTFGDRFAAGIAAENPQVLSPGGSYNLNAGVSYLWGQPGAGGGLYNGAASDGSTTTSACTANTATPPVITCTPVVPPQLTTYAINPIPDFIAKVAFDPGFGHYEVFGITRLFRDRVYNGTPVVTSKYNDNELGGGLGGSARVPLFAKKLDVGLKGLWGTGVGRYGNTTIADVTVKPTGQFSPLHGFSALGTLELHATPRFDLYANYGGDYTGKTLYQNALGKTDGYGWNESNAGCATEPIPTSPVLPAAPAGCSGQTRDVQEGTLGYWYDFYKGPKGRLRQGIQYSYAVREVWADKEGYAPKGIENMFWTSFRYYLP